MPQLSQRITSLGAAGVTFLLMSALASANPATLTSAASSDSSLLLVSPVDGIEFESTPVGPDNVLDKLRRGFDLTYADNHRTQAELKWFARHPEYLDRVFVAATASAPIPG